MTSQYITNALRACALPIKAWASADGTISLLHMKTYYGSVHYPEHTKQATRAYTQLRDKLLQAEEMKK